MFLIDQGGKRVRAVCRECHRVRVTIRPGVSVCDACRKPKAPGDLLVAKLLAEYRMLRTQQLSA